MRPAPELSPVLYELFPSRWDDQPVNRARTVFAGLAGEQDFGVEFAASGGSLRFFLRAVSPARAASVLGQVRAAHPQADFEPIPVQDHPHLDPLSAASHEAAISLELRLSRDSAFPLDIDPRHGEPLAGVLAAAVSSAGRDVRVIGQVLVGDPPRARWAPGVQARAVRPSVRSLPMQRPETSTASLLLFVALAGAGAIGMQGYAWLQEGQYLPLLAAGIVALIGLPVGAVVWLRYTSGREPLTPVLAEQKLAFPAFTACVRLTVIGRSDDAELLEQECRRVAAAYEAFDHPSGNGLRGHRRRYTVSLPSDHRGGWLRRPTILNAAELSALWHLPDPSAGLPMATKPGGRRFLPADDATARGGRVGVSRHHGQSVPVHFPQGALYRNHLIVAKTRRGKSTLLQHVAAHLMRQVASGRERVLLVVIDPHQDLAESVLSVVPPGLDDRIAYLDLTDRRRPVGLNLLDVALFPNRDRTTENIVSMLHRTWPDNWGPRMEGALRAALLALHQANQVRRREQQYTLLDVVPVLMSPEFRERVMSQVPDQALWAWWRNNYDNLGRPFQLQIAAPVTTKVGRFEVTEAARLTLGQAQSTIDPRSLLHDGGVLVVNTAVGVLGEGGSALIGATLLNLLSSVVEDQVDLPAAERSRMVALIDESSTLGGADYPRMMSELGKYGAAFVLVTQSLAKLDAIDTELRPTVFANLDSLTVFQVSAEDARYLAPELGHDLEVDDLVSLDDYECYARWSSGGHRHPAFSLRLDPPAPVDPARVAAIAARSAARFGRARADVARQIDRVLTSRAESTGKKVPAEVVKAIGGGAQDGEPANVQVKRTTDPPPMARNENRDQRKSQGPKESKG
ncbi:MAG: type IV secretory system conjugative DNA transfer family protein [Dehalococcoidia bacterium]|nr:type IV secretory system conjugative DNA transfer family protein [Dehalococcoidia bacterium]